MLGRKTHAGLAAVLALTLGGACARNPVSGRPEVTLVSEAKERELGEAEARRVAETMGILEDPVLSAYVRAVGERLAQFSSRTDVGIGQDVRGRRDRTFSEKRSCYAALRTKWRAAVRRV